MASPLATTSRHTLRGFRSREIARSISSTSRSDFQANTAASSTSQHARPQASRSGLPQDPGTHLDRQPSALRSVALQHMADLGSTQTKETSFRPFKARLDPVTARQLTVSHLLASTAHVGHSVSSLDRAHAPFLYGTRHGQAIIDVEKYTLPALRQACKVVKDIVYRDGVVVFLGSAPGTERAVLQAAQRLGKNGFHVTKQRWIPGVLTNAPKLLSLAILGDMDKYEEQLKEKRGRRTEPDAATLASQDLQPDLLVVLNPKENIYAIREATTQKIPTIGIIDTDVDPRTVTYAIPANDESIRTAELIVGVLSKAGEEGMKERKRKEDELHKKRSAAAARRRDD